MSILDAVPEGPLLPDSAGGGLPAELTATPGTPDEIARDEHFWLQVRSAFTLDETMINLESGGGSPSPKVVLDAVKARMDYGNVTPPISTWKVLEPQREIVRRRLARQWGVDAEEVAITRSASEGMQICQCGIDLQAGDEVLTTNQDYGRMLWTYEQRQRREGIVLRQISIPVPCEDPAEIVRKFREAITPRTRLVHLSHLINLSGQIMPVRDVVDLAHEHGLPVVVDGAHSVAHIDFQIPELCCDFFASSLHKWLCAPLGTGLLYVRRDRIAGLWPLTPAPASMREDIRKFEEIGTYDVAHLLGIAEALAFHQCLGPKRRQARLLFLREYWMDRLGAESRIRWNTSRKPGMACGIANFDIPGVQLHKLHRWLLVERSIVTHVTEHPEYTGIRVTPNVFTSLEELDRFCDAVSDGIRLGIGA